MKRVIVEAACVAIGGLLFAFVANAVSPHGLKLGRDYFHLITPVPTPIATPTPPSPTSATNPAPAPESLGDSLRAVGLGLIDGRRAQALFNDPRREQGLVLFIDAREEEPYQAGHIPGAYEFNNFHPEKYAATVVPACQIAQEIVVYCNGGACDESKFAALTLRDYLSGLPKPNLVIYGGGMTEWSTNQMPVELGERNSGRLRDADAPANPSH